MSIYFMQAQSSLINISDAKIYHFSHKRAELIRAEKWFIKECGQSLVVIKNQEGTAEIHLKKQIIIINYKDFKAYFSKMEKGYVSIHIPIDNDTIELFQYKLQENSLKLIDWSQSKAEVQKDIQKQCGSNIHEVRNVQTSNLQKVGYQVGKFFGNFNNLIKSSPVEKKSKQLTEKVEELKEEKLSQDSKQQLKGIKSRLSSINQAIISTMKPASDKISQATANLGNKFQQSDNFVIKGIRNFGHTLKNSLNEGYKVHRDKAFTQEKQQNHQKAIESQRGLK